MRNESWASPAIAPAVLLRAGETAAGSVQRPGFELVADGSMLLIVGFVCALITVAIIVGLVQYHCSKRAAASHAACVTPTAWSHWTVDSSGNHFYLT
uniref:Uncharacterized protein n=1 Tax=Plectus sambesii TaxID=2011161 RepID=A0A914WUZ2_9BILA